MVVPGTTVIVLRALTALVKSHTNRAPVPAMESIPLSQLAVNWVPNNGVNAAVKPLVQSAKSNVVLPPVALPPTIVTLKDRKSPVAASRLPPSGITLSSHMKVPLPVWPLFPVNVNEGTDKLT